MLRIARLACITLLTLPAAAFAQLDDMAVPAPTCVKPIVPAATASLSKPAADKLNAEITAYASCGDSYLKARRATTAKYQAIANAHVVAANTFATDFNAFSVELGAFSKTQAAKAAKAE